MHLHKDKEADQVTSSQHSSPWTILLYRNGLQEKDLSRRGNHYALVFQDYLTKWPEVYAVEDRKAITVAHCLADFLWQHGVPVKSMIKQQSFFQIFYKRLLRS